MAKDYNELVQLRQDGKINDLLFVMENKDINQTYLDWCIENNIEPSETTASQFLEEMENEMFEFQSNQDYHGIFAL